jgi:hypothetical protein
MRDESWGDHLNGSRIRRLCLDALVKLVLKVFDHTVSQKHHNCFAKVEYRNRCSTDYSCSIDTWARRQPPYYIAASQQPADQLRLNPSSGLHSILSFFSIGLLLERRGKSKEQKGVQRTSPAPSTGVRVG